MKYEDKLAAYDSLVRDVQSCTRCDTAGGSVKLMHCPLSREVNLWSCWEGGRKRLDAKVLLVGQDWGPCCSDDHIWSVLQALGQGCNAHLYMSGNDSKTDDHLIELFKNIGYDVKNDSNSTRPSEDLFFTNFVLCYRSKGLSGGFRNIWVRNCSDHFRRLVSIIEPKIVLCLGRKVYEGVMRALDGREAFPGWKRYNERLDARTPSTVPGTDCLIFPLAHCGIMGTNTRNRGKEYNDILDVQILDWKAIERYL